MRQEYFDWTQYWDVKEYNKTISLQRFTKGQAAQVIFQNKKKAKGIIQRVQGKHADIKIGNKTYLINWYFVILSQIK